MGCGNRSGAAQIRKQKRNKKTRVSVGRMAAQGPRAERGDRAGGEGASAPTAPSRTGLGRGWESGPGKRSSTMVGQDQGRRGMPVSVGIRLGDGDQGWAQPGGCPALC